MNNNSLLNLYCRLRNPDNPPMHDLVYWIAGLVGLAFLIHGLTDWFSRDARVGRKRRRNHGQISYRTKQPTILLSVRTKKPPKK